jgi:pimeloyl-ACP methyl ester carboxylesterase
MAALAITPLRQSKSGYGLVFSSKPDAAITRRWIDPALRSGRICRDASKVLRGMRPEETLDVASRLDRFAKPVHLVWGDSDTFFPMAVAERLAEAFPNASLTTIPDARTFVSMDHPETVAQVIACAVGAG